MLFSFAYAMFPVIPPRPLLNCRRYINTNNFLRNVRNFKMDITRTDPNAYVCAIHWQVAQGTSLENIEFYMSQAAGNTQQVSDTVYGCTNRSVLIVERASIWRTVVVVL